MMMIAAAAMRGGGRGTTRNHPPSSRRSSLQELKRTTARRKTRRVAAAAAAAAMVAARGPPPPHRCRHQVLCSFASTSCRHSSSCGIGGSHVLRSYSAPSSLSKDFLLRGRSGRIPPENSNGSSCNGATTTRAAPGPAAATAASRGFSSSFAGGGGGDDGGANSTGGVLVSDGGNGDDDDDDADWLAAQRRQRIGSSRVGKRAAADSLEAAVRLVDSLDAFEEAASSSAEAAVATPAPHPGQLQQALVYWTSGPAREELERRRVARDGAAAGRDNDGGDPSQPSAAAMLDDPLDYAEKIVRWAIRRGDWSMLERILALSTNAKPVGRDGDDVSPHVNGNNTQICRMVRFWMQPLQGTYASLKLWGYRRQQKGHVEEAKVALCKASKLWKTLEDLHRNPDAANFEPDDESRATLLLLWNRRIKLLSLLPGSTNGGGSASVDLNGDETLAAALGGQNSIQGCLAAMKSILEELLRDGGNSTDAGRMYGILLSAYAQGASSLPQMADDARELLRRLEEGEEGGDYLKFTTRHFNSVFLAYSNSIASIRITSKDNPDVEMVVEKALGLWNHMMTLQSPHVSASDPVTVSVLMNLLRKAGRPQQVQDILDFMETKARESKRDYPSLMHYNACLSAWAKSKTPEAGNRAEAVLHRMTHLADVRPDRISYTAVIEALLFSAADHGMDRAEAILSLCEESTPDDANGMNLVPDTATYLTFLRGLLFRHRREIDSQLKEAICYRMEKILSRMLERSKGSRSLVNKPTTETYCLCLDGWSRSLSTLAPSHAMALVEEMDKNDIAPNAELFELALKCLCVSPETGSNNRETTIENANKLLGQMDRKGILKTTEVFNQYLRVLGRTGAVREAERLVREAEQDSELSADESACPIQPNDSSYYALIEGHAKFPGGEREADRLLRKYIDIRAKRTRAPPKPHMFSTVMGAWGCSKDPDAIDRVEQLFNEACQYGKPNGYIFGTYLTALYRASSDGRCPDAPEKIEQILSLMQQEYESGSTTVKPNASNFATAISCWAVSGKDGAAERAQAILDRLEALSDGDPRYHNLKPTVACYRAAIVAWAMSDRRDVCGDRALAILDRMERRRERSKSSSVLPNESCYKHIIIAIGKSADHQNKAEKAYSVVKSMNADYKEGNRHAQATSQIYVAALRSIGSTEGSPSDLTAAFGFAQKVLEEYHNNRSAKSHGLDGKYDAEKVYLQFLWAASRLLPPDDPSFRDEAIRRALKRFCPPDLLKSSKRIRRSIRKIFAQP